MLGEPLPESWAKAEEQFNCITPTLETVSNVDTLERALQSHRWQIRKREPFGEDGFLTMIFCVNCGLERTAIISNIKESAKAAAEHRKSKPR
jgi:hypothetical protein